MAAVLIAVVIVFVLLVATSLSNQQQLSSAAGRGTSTINLNRQKQQQQSSSDNKYNNNNPYYNKAVINSGGGGGVIGATPAANVANVKTAKISINEPALITLHGVIDAPRSGNSKMVAMADTKTSSLTTISTTSRSKTAGVTISQPITTTTIKENPKSMLKRHQEKMSLLFDDLFTDYKKEAAPSNPVEVDLKVLLIKVKNTIEREGIFECVVALFIAWYDPRLTWDPEHYDNITTLAFEPERLWLPDIAMTNSADHVYSISRDTRFVVRVSNDGRSVFVPSGTSRSWCDLKLVTFPFDQQTCSLDFESWTLDNSSLVFDRSSNVLVDDTNTNYYSTQWKLCYFKTTIRNVTYSDSMGGTFQRISFTLNIHRKSSFYLVNLIFPIAMLSVIQLVIFFIPGIDSASSRIGFGTTNLLTLVVFQTIVTEELPKTSDAVTALSQYIIALIIFSAYGIFESVIVECILRMEEQQRAPGWIRRLVENTTRRNRFYSSSSPAKAIAASVTQLLLATSSITPDKNNNNNEISSSQHHHDVMMDVDLETRRKTNVASPSSISISVPTASTSSSTATSSPYHSSPQHPHRYKDHHQPSSAAVNSNLKRTKSQKTVYDNYLLRNTPVLSRKSVTPFKLAIADDCHVKQHRSTTTTTLKTSTCDTRCAAYFKENCCCCCDDGDDEASSSHDCCHRDNSDEASGEDMSSSNNSDGGEAQLPPLQKRRHSYRHNQRQRRVSQSANVQQQRQPRGSSRNNNNNKLLNNKQHHGNNNCYSNYLYWSDFAMILDYVSFCACTFLAVFIPVVLFVPLVNSTDTDSCIN